MAYETQDACKGHPQESGVYRYHSRSNCVADQREPSGHSALVGYLLDGFGIYGPYSEKGQALACKDLDEFHGHMQGPDDPSGTPPCQFFQSDVARRRQLRLSAAPARPSATWPTRSAGCYVAPHTTRESGRGPRC